MELSIIIKGMSGVIVLLNMVTVSESHYGWNRIRDYREQNVVPNFQDDLPGDAANQNKTLFEPRCDVKLIRAISTQTKTRTSTTTFTTVVTSEQIKTGTVIISIVFSAISATFSDVNYRTELTNAGALHPLGATVCRFVGAGVMAAGANRFILVETTLTSTPTVSYSHSCSATTIFPTH
ncbi:hypothetical protein ACF0H5_021732 [Mactra antiquata]